MTPPTAWLQLTLNEARMVWRDPAGLVMPLGLPLLILVMNGMGADRTGVPELGGRSPFDAVLVPVTLAMVLAMIAVINMPSFLATYRKTGVLRRLAVTPAGPVMVLVAQAAVAVAQVLAGILLALAVARFAFGLEAPASPAAAVGAFLLAVAAMFAVGMLVAAVAPTTNAAIAIGLVAFLGMLAFTGMFGGEDALPGWLATVGEHTPFGATVATLGQAWAGGPLVTSHVLALAGTATVAAALAAITFRWE